MKHGNVIRKRRNICLGCGMPFLSLRARRKFCGLECYAIMHLNAGTKDYYHGRYDGYEISKEGSRTPLQALVAGFKMNFGCVDCGYLEHPVALQFDHITGVKKMDVSKIRSLKLLMREIGKCEVVCANCHSIRTYNRLQAAKKRKADRRAAVPRLVVDAIFEAING